jgi:DNA-directed RNA polymerase specialized sigma24 family protein
VKAIEEQLVAWSRTEEPAAYRRLVSTYAPMIYDFCYRLLGESEAANRASRQVFRQAYERLPRAEAPVHLGCWFLAVAYEHCLECTGQLGPAHGGARGQMGQAAEDRPGGDPQRLLRALSILDRTVVVLRYWNHLSYDEIACVTGESIADVARRLHRARRRMLGALAQQHHSRELMET